MLINSIKNIYLYTVMLFTMIFLLNRNIFNGRITDLFLFGDEIIMGVKIIAVL